MIQLEDDVDVAFEGVLRAGERVTARDLRMQLERVAEDACGADALLRAVAIVPEVERDVGARDETIDARGDGAVIERVERDVRASREDVGAQHVEALIRGTVVGRIGWVLLRTDECRRIPGVAGAPFLDHAADR